MENNPRNYTDEELIAMDRNTQVVAQSQCKVDPFETGFVIFVLGVGASFWLGTTIHTPVLGFCVAMFGVFATFGLMVKLGV